MSGTTSFTRQFTNAAARLALLCALALGACLALAPRAAAAEALLPNLVADPPTGISLETSTNEGGLKKTAEPELLLRFNGYIHNLGPGAVDFRGSRKSSSEAMKAFQRVFNSDGTFKEEPSAAELIYVTADGHEHWHLQRAAKYSLWNLAKSAEVAPAMKVGFCLDDSEHVEPAIGPKTAVYSDATGREFCRQHQPEATSLFEGISPGWRDLYSSNLAFQWVDASSVLPGEYFLREDVNTLGVIKETGGANVPAYTTSPVVIPGFNALAQSVSTQSGTAQTITLTSKAFKDSATPTYKVLTGPSHGTLSAVNKNQVTYTPSAGYTGPDSFTFSAADPTSPFPRSPAVASVSIEVGASTGGKGLLLAGDATSSYAVGDQTTAGREEAFQFTAKSSGTVEELQFRTNATANTGVTGVVLGILAESAGKPGEVLGSGGVSGEPATNSWVKATGLSTSLIAGTKYWLVALPLGPSSAKLHYNAAVGSGGTGNVESKTGGLTTMSAQSSWETFNQGPVGFQAIGSTGVAEASVTIEGAPASMTAGSSVQLTAHVVNDSSTVTWKASAGTITTGGLYTAPSEPPAGGKATVTVTTAKGAHDERTIEILAAASKGLLAGDATSTYAVGDQTTAGREEAFQFTAKSSGTVEELQFRTNATANTGLTGVVLGIFAENAGKPGEVLASASASGLPATNSWIKVTGLSKAIVSGTKYWLMALPLGPSSAKLHFNAAVGSGGAGNVESITGSLAAMTAEASWESYNQGPVGFQALGTISGAASVSEPAALPAARSAAVPAPSSTAPTLSNAAGVAIEGAPSSIIAGTSVQLAVPTEGGVPAVSWRASAGKITKHGLYTAPLHPPRGGTVRILAKREHGAAEERTIAVLPVPVAQPAPAAQFAAPGAATAGVATPQALIVGPKLILSTWAGKAGVVSLSAYIGSRRLGGCSARSTAGRGFTCRLSLPGLSAYSSIGVRASLRHGARELESLRTPAPVAAMSMPSTLGVSLLLHNGASTAQFICSAAAAAAKRGAVS